MSDELRVTMRKMACELLLAANGQKHTERLSATDMDVIISVRPRTASVEVPVSADLKGIHKKLLAVITAEPKTAKAIARAAGYSITNDDVRKALHHLVRLRFVRRTSDGYTLPKS